MSSILSLGAVYLDINATDFPIPHDANKLINTESMGEKYEVVLGGSAVNFVRFCQSLGLSTYFIGKTGKDYTSDILEKLFQKESIHSLLSASQNFQTNLNTNLVGDNGSTLMLSFGNANQSLSSDDIMTQLQKHIEKIDYLYVGGCFKLKTLLPNLLKIVEFVKSHNKKVVVDHGRVVNTVTDKEKELIRHVAEEVDYYLLSKDEFLELWNVKNIEEGLLLFENTHLTVVVKDAENGAWTIQDSEILHVPAFKVNSVNTVGAGDSFNAGFIAATSEKKFLKDAIRFANATAAFKISQKEIPTQQMINTFIGNNL